MISKDTLRRPVPEPTDLHPKAQREPATADRLPPTGDPLTDREHHRPTTMTSYSSAVGGKPESTFELTTARRRPKRAAVVGIWNRSLVMTSSTTPEARSGRS